MLKLTLRRRPPISRVTLGALGAILVLATLAPTNVAAQTTRVSVSTAGTEGNSASTRANISADGRYIVFKSSATNLAPAGPGNIFVRMRTSSPSTVRVPLVLPNTFELQQGFASLAPSISDDGRFVADHDTVIDRQSGVQTTLPVIPTPGFPPFPPVGGVLSAVVSRDGSRAAYVTGPAAWSGTASGQYAYRTLAVRTLATGATCQYSAPLTQFFGPEPPPFVAGGAFQPPVLSMSSTGALVAFTSNGSYLAPGGPAGYAVYLFDCTTQTMSLGSVATSGRPLEGGNAALSGDGRYLAFGTHDPEFGPEGALVVRDRTSGTTTVAVASTATFDIEGLLSLSDDGRYLTFVARQSGQTGYYVVDRSTSAVRRVDVAAGGGAANAGVVFHPSSHAGSANGRFVAFTSPATNLVAGDANAADDIFLRDMFDDDGDSITNEWETFFGFNPQLSTDATLDSDGDGKTNAEEFAAGTHPTGLSSATRYFAEGAANDFFDTRIAVSNPSTSATARVLLRFIKPDGSIATQLATLAPQRAYQLLVDSLPAVNGSAFATVVESDTLVVADRLMWWAGTAYGTHGEHSVNGPALSWYFAEGATHSGFELFYLVLNPNPTTSSVRVRYLLPAGAALERTYTVPANSRFNIWVDQELFNGVATLANTDVSAVFEVQNSVPVIVERAMYLSPPGGPTFSAGHASVGTTAPANSWFFAEGATGDFFDEYVLVANPGVSASVVRARYLLSTGQSYIKDYTVAANSRFNIWVDEESLPIVGKVLRDVALSVQLDVVSGPPVVAERSMWWPGPTSATWLEAHNVVGSNVAATRWGFAEGAVSGAPGNTETYLLVANTSTTAASVRVTLLYTDSTPAESRTYVVAPTSRFNIPVGSQFPNSLDRNFGAVVESIGGSAPPIVVERAVYNDAGGLHWAAGTAALGTPLP